jgi:uncharacterized membrane protein required for colicin V production
MTIYDAVMAGLLVAGMGWGAWRGITWQLASIASLVLGFSVSHPLSAQLAPRFPGEPVVARALAMLAIYVAVSGGVFLVAWIVRSTLRQLKFEAFDRHLGMIIGGLEAALLGMIATLFVVSLAPQTRAPIFASFSGRIVGQAMNLVGPILPGELRDALAPFWDENAPGDRFADNNETFRPAPLTRPSAPGRRADGGSTGKSTTPNFQDLLEEGESRLGRVIVEAAEKGLQSTGDGNDREVKRR